MREKISIISLGCARNLVDSEVMAGLLRQGPYEVVSEPSHAQIVLVNTCSFIDAAKEESLDAILEVSRLKEEGKLRTLVVAGCLSQRYSEELMRELPEVDLFIGTGEVPRIVEILQEHQQNQRRHYVGIPSYLYDHATPRRRSTPSFWAYVKVSEGCDHKCAFCIIPKLRGPHRSRPIGSVVAGRRRGERDQPDRSGPHRLRAGASRRHNALRSASRTRFGDWHPVDSASLCLSEFSRRVLAELDPREREDLQVSGHPLPTCQRAHSEADAAWKKRQRRARSAG